MRYRIIFSDGSKTDPTTGTGLKTRAKGARHWVEGDSSKFIDTIVVYSTSTSNETFELKILPVLPDTTVSTENSDVTPQTFTFTEEGKTLTGEILNYPGSQARNDDDINVKTVDSSVSEREGYSGSGSPSLAAADKRIPLKVTVQHPSGEEPPD